MYYFIIESLAIFKILQGVTKRELLNNQDILDEVTQLIKGILNDELLWLNNYPYLNVLLMSK